MKEQKGNSVLFLSYWYPNKISPIFPVFTRKHAEAVAVDNNVIVLTLSFIRSRVVYRRTAEIRRDSNGIETHQIYVESLFSKLLYVFLPLHYKVLKSYIKEHLAQHRFNIFHSNVLFPCAIVGARLSSFFRTQHVITEHWSRLDHFFERSFYRRTGRKTYDSAAAITCVSEVLRMILKRHTKNSKVYIVPNVIDTKEFYFDESLTKYPTYTFVAAANWTPPKQPFYFLDALERIHSGGKISDFELLLIGNGVQLEQVESRKYSFPIRFTGILNAKQLHSELNRSHLFLHGSDFETFSTIIAEALMCGLPCVVSPVGIASEVIHAANGFITNNTPEDWVEKIVLCYNTHYNPKLISEEYKKRYDLESVGKLFSEIYKGM